MPIEVINGTQNILYRFLKFSEGSLILKAENSDEELRILTPLNLDTSVALEEFEVFFLAKKDVKESEIYQVYDFDREVRIGWCIPILSLISNQHEYADNPHFLRYAYTASALSLNKIDKDSYSKYLPVNNDNVQLTDIFDESTVFLVISKSTLGGTNFDFEKAAPYFFKYGYVKLLTRNPSEIDYVADAPIGKRINLQFVSGDLTNYQLINELLNFSVAYEKNLIFKFFYLYQILELLIELVYQNEQQTIIKELICVQGDTGKTKEVLEKLQKLLSEKNRIKLLESNYMIKSVNIDELKSNCNQLLKILSRKEGSNLADTLYPIETVKTFV